MAERRAGELAAARALLDEVYAIVVALKDSNAIGRVLVERASVLQLTGAYEGALQDLYDALRIYEDRKDRDGAATVYNAIGALHHNAGNFREAASFYGRSLAIRQVAGKADEIAILNGNLGSVLEDLGRPDSALIHHRLNLAYRLKAGEPSWVAICYANLGTCLARLGRTDSALHYLERSIAILERGSEVMLQAQTRAMIGKVELDARNYARARSHCSRGLEQAERIGALMIQKMCHECLYGAYEAQGEDGRALASLQRMILIQDSLLSTDRAKGLVMVEMNYAFERQQLADSLKRSTEKQTAELAYQMRISRERSEKRVFIVGAVFTLFLAIGLWSRLRYMHRSRNMIESERARSEKLLLNILPRTIAEELKAKGRAEAREVEMVSILFTDFHEFSVLSGRMEAQELVAEIDTYFRAFDGITRSHGLEKIKTIGDAYMCAGGLPERREGSAVDTVRAALAMQRWVDERATERERVGKSYFTMRAGIHTGGVVAGIVGDSKIQYDVWGDTVNIAARMETSSHVGRVNISEATYELVKGHHGFVFEPRGMINVKGMGELAMWFVRERSG